MNGPSLAPEPFSGPMQELQPAISKLEAQQNMLEKSSPGHRATALQTQHVSPMLQKPSTPAEDEEDNYTDLFGSGKKEENKEAARLGEEQLQRYAEVKKPARVAQSSILQDVEPWDDETDMAQLETCVHSVQMDRLVSGASKLMPIQCVVEDHKVGTDLRKKKIDKFEEHVQSVNITVFNKI
ncbi:Elongation factor 1-delta [Saguinus oedipus]|uniref:Elongation factor 1-delta n=1 Tax=Saguinus oedipus TaxID=9490 RepID=A0ABQ9VY60_SAGOE|nr:Elongation factor 1-delta [Saguinus oedipus]